MYIFFYWIYFYFAVGTFLMLRILIVVGVLKVICLFKLGFDMVAKYVSKYLKCVF